MASFLTVTGAVVDVRGPMLTMSEAPLTAAPESAKKVYDLRAKTVFYVELSALGSNDYKVLVVFEDGGSVFAGRYDQASYAGLVAAAIIEGSTYDPDK